MTQETSRIATNDRVSNVSADTTSADNKPYRAMPVINPIIELCAAREAAEAGEAAAAKKIAMMFMDGGIFKENHVQAGKWLAIADQLEEDPSAAAKLFPHSRFSVADAAGHYEVGTKFIHEQKIVVEREKIHEQKKVIERESVVIAADPVEAIYHIALAARELPVAMAHIGASLYNGSVIHQNLPLAAQYFKASALDPKSPSEKGAYGYGKMLYEGEGVAQDKDMGINYLRIGVELRHYPSQVYLESRGVKTPILNEPRGYWASFLKNEI